MRSWRTDCGKKLLLIKHIVNLPQRNFNGLPLLTGNDKHYRVIKDIQIKKYRP